VALWELATATAGDTAGDTVSTTATATATAGDNAGGSGSGSVPSSGSGSVPSSGSGSVPGSGSGGVPGSGSDAAVAVAVAVAGGRHYALRLFIEALFVADDDPEAAGTFFFLFFSVVDSILYINCLPLPHAFFFFGISLPLTSQNAKQTATLPQLPLTGTCHNCHSFVPAKLPQLPLVCTCHTATLPLVCTCHTTATTATTATTRLVPATLPKLPLVCTCHTTATTATLPPCLYLPHNRHNCHTPAAQFSPAPPSPPAHCHCQPQPQPLCHQCQCQCQCQCQQWQCQQCQCQWQWQCQHRQWQWQPGATTPWCHSSTGATAGGCWQWLPHTSPCTSSRRSPCARRSGRSGVRLSASRELFFSFGCLRTSREVLENQPVNCFALQFCCFALKF
jgi:hypothetical protein